MDLLLKNLCWHNGIEKISGDIRISKGTITEVGQNLQNKKNEHVGNFENQFLYPGLINSHDHLEMNLYPRLGKPPYNNYIEWANDIYKPSQSPVREIEKLDIKDRLLWGGLKNLISGVTTVVHHNPWHRILSKGQFPIRVIKTAWAHSLAFEKRIQKKFPRKENSVFVIHAAEGINQTARSEISGLNNLGLLKKNTVLIHAVGIDDMDISLISNNQASVVWCPASNFFMFGQTTPLEKLKNKVAVALGSDSTLTGSSTLLHEMQFASKKSIISAREIYEMTTRIPAQIYHLPSPLIAINQPADLFAAQIKHENYFENLLTVGPPDISLVLTKGIPRLKNAEAEDKWAFLKNIVKIQGTLKYSNVDVHSLKRSIKRKVEVSILETNPLWNLIEA